MFIPSLYGAEKEEGVVIGPLPSLPIPKGNAGPSLLSHILIGKYVDHLPLYRQQKQFKRLGVEISDKTICGWVSASCQLLTPLYEKLMKNVQQSGYIQADETPIKVLDKEKKRGSSNIGRYEVVKYKKWSLLIMLCHSLYLLFGLAKNHSIIFF